MDINDKEKLKVKISMLENLILELPDKTEKDREYIRDTHHALNYCLMKYLYLCQLQNEYTQQAEIEYLKRRKNE